MRTKSRLPIVSAALLTLFLAAGCVSAPKEAETVPAAQAEAEADAGSSASTDAESGASASY